MLRSLPIFTIAVVFAAGLFVHEAQASFTIYQGNSTQESAWQAAAGGSVPLENFESFTGTPNTGVGGSVLMALPSVHVTFDAPYPGVYSDASFAHSGANQWSNWAAGAGNSSNHVLRPEAGLLIYALGFWQCDPQGSQPMLAYDQNNNLLGTIVGLINTHQNDPAHSTGFAGFISDVPVAYVTIPGNLGDGWNHFDDLQVVTRSAETAVPESASLTIWAVLGLVGLVAGLRRRA